MIIHTREAQDDTIAILKEEHASEIGGVFHCFSGDAWLAKDALDLGFYLSFSGILTFQNATMLRDIAKTAPLDRLLIETDCPYLTPIPHRGRRNEPAYVSFVAQKLAETSRRRARHVGRDHRTHYDRERETPVQNRSSCRLRCRSALGNFLGFPRFSGLRFGRRSSPYPVPCVPMRRVEFGPSRSFPTNS
mgnify:CR=1 FL=1